MTLRHLFPLCIDEHLVAKSHGLKKSLNPFIHRSLGKPDQRFNLLFYGLVSTGHREAELPTQRENTHRILKKQNQILPHDPKQFKISLINGQLHSSNGS